MTNLIEGVARAICAVEEQSICGMCPPGECLGKRYKGVAKAAIEAMREPTDEMIKAAIETDGMKAVSGMITLAFVHGMKLPEGVPSPLLQAWRAMIDKALGKEATE